MMQHQSIDLLLCAQDAEEDRQEVNQCSDVASCCDGYILEGKELEFYVRKMQK
eukprot:CAMPEP_0182858106 /NCGR_PEP_ID=MMETSP0034_2-20130328/3466_1 /TAXON_ID=156128 /ORGANISM="Nephroselmis pyriformis, Strain CCMP717" /LENGTH=52 /DNA_ID=CAMNT_0024989455 /DNA_START=92 /DNA_END=247 /DNA_ORIENTATION=-